MKPLNLEQLMDDIMIDLSRNINHLERKIDLSKPAFEYSPEEAYVKAIHETLISVHNAIGGAVACQRTKEELEELATRP